MILFTEIVPSAEFGRQEDAHEFITGILSLLHEEAGTAEDSPLNSIFQGGMLSESKKECITAVSFRIPSHDDLPMLFVCFSNVLKGEMPAQHYEVLIFPA